MTPRHPSDGDRQGRAGTEPRRHLVEYDAGGKAVVTKHFDPVADLHNEPPFAARISARSRTGSAPLAGSTRTSVTVWPTAFCMSAAGLNRSKSKFCSTMPIPRPLSVTSPAGSGRRRREIPSAPARWQIDLPLVLGQGAVVVDRYCHISPPRSAGQVISACARAGQRWRSRAEQTSDAWKISLKIQGDNDHYNIMSTR